MSVLAFVEIDNGTIKKSSQEIISFAKGVASELNDTVTAVFIGKIEEMEAAKAGIYGADKSIVVNDQKLFAENAMAYADALSKIINSENSDLIIFGKSGLCDAVAARTAVKVNASIVSGVIELPKIGGTFTVKRTIFSGKAFVITKVLTDKKIIVVNKNSIEALTNGENAPVAIFNVDFKDKNFNFTVESTEKASGDVSLSDADIIVSGGRGMKGPEHWQPLIDLAKELGAATGCSKPVSDLDWRPHHEHIGQTGIKVAPNLYIACGISGAIQHLAGVSGSKRILVINKDPEASFFKAADYGIVGDVFEILPRLTAAIKKSK